MIVLAATPIGNLGDASPRLRETLAGADVIAAEDTRHTRQLLALLGVNTDAEVIALHDHNEAQKAQSLVDRARAETVVLVSDAGMPTVSDPGFKVVERATEVGVPVTVIPGPSAVITALALSGLPTDRFSFEGFVPRKPGDRRQFFERVATDPRTLVCFESPKRLAATLRDAAAVLGSDRPAAVCRELTKLHEEARRGTLEDLAEWAEGGVRGEIALVIGGHTARRWTAAEADARVAALRADGLRLKDATREVAERSGHSARELYARALGATSQPEPPPKPMAP